MRAWHDKLVGEEISLKIDSLASTLGWIHMNQVKHQFSFRLLNFEWFIKHQYVTRMENRAMWQICLSSWKVQSKMLPPKSQNSKTRKSKYRLERKERSNKKRPDYFFHQEIAIISVLFCGMIKSEQKWLVNS